MPIIDAQVHGYERNHPGRPWLGSQHGREEITGDQMVTAMDAVGVDAAPLVSVFSTHGYDAFGRIPGSDPGRRARGNKRRRERMQK
jgi:hypothetical protein